MTINVYTFAYNDEFMLPHFLKHYEKFVDRIFVLDHQSTDKTAEIARAHPKVVYVEYKHPTYSEEQMSRTFEKIVKQYPSDWAVCVDTDEFIEGLDELPDKKGLIFKTTGYMMIGEDIDRFSPDTQGFIRMESFDKPVVFDPSIDIKFGDGRHSCNLPTTNPDKLIKHGLNLLHYKYPSREYYLQRSLDRYPRIMDAPTMAKLIKKGLKWYDEHI